MPYTEKDRERSIKMYTILEALVDDVEDHSLRIRGIENSQAKAFFGQGLIGALVAFCTAWVTK